MASRLIVHPAENPARNMAIDEALLRLVQTPTLRIYAWSQPCVSLGYFQKASVAPSDRPFVRRYTGGGLVEHGQDLTYTLVLPPLHPLTTAGTLFSYQTIHQAIAQALHDCGVPCHLATAKPDQDDPACFLKPVPADILDPKGRKLAGAAQRRTKQGCLHQGTILLSQAIPAQLLELLPESLGECLGQPLLPSTMTPPEIQLANELEQDRYSRREWNFSR
ncbi:MAG: biotin/lipoate A/B protein ligase family protein [Verrucomicrobia bacterium]|nr:biotin/lipoate A/B protein ligase family protein [Verrucomicrobiota bacterium]